MGEGSDVHLYLISEILGLNFDNLLILLFAVAIILLLISSSVCESLFLVSKRQLLNEVAENKKQRFAKLFNLRNKLKYSCYIGSYFIITFIFSLAIYWTSNHYKNFTFIDVIWGALITFGVNIIVSYVVAVLFSQRKPVKMLKAFLQFQSFIMYLFYPIIIVIETCQQILGKFVGAPELGDTKIAEDRIIESVKDARDLAVLPEESEKMIMQVLELKETSASEIMTPRTDMISISQDATIPEALKLAHEHGHSRIPVFKDTRDVIVGIFYTRDLLPLFAEGKDLSTMKVIEISRQPVMIPETKNIVMLLQDLKSEKLSMVVLVDEYGGTAGLVTLEDLLEEIVGDIRDEYDEDEADYSIVQVDGSDDKYEADARCRLDQIKDELGVELPEDEDYDTLGGYLSFVFGHVPEVGKGIEDEYFKYEIVKSDERKIEKVCLQRKRPTGKEGKDTKTSQRLPKTPADPA